MVQKKKSNEIVPIINIGDITKGLEVNIDKNDLVTYKVVQIEKKLDAKRVELETEINDLENKLKKLDEDFNKAGNVLIHTKYDATAKEMTDAFAAAGMPLIAVVKAGFASHNDITPGTKLYHEDEEDDKQYCHAYILVSTKKPKSRGYHNSPSDLFTATQDKVPYTKEMKQMIKDQEEKREQLEKLEEEHTEVRIKLGQMDKLERHARAELTAQALEGAEIGGKLLKSEEGE